MRFFRKILSAAFCAVLLLWYCNPSVYRLFNEPIGTGSQISAPALSVTEEGAVFVRVSNDQRLHNVSGSLRTVRLFGILPVRTVEQSALRTSVSASGEAIGIVLHTRGVQVVGLGGVQTGHGTANPAANAGIRPGDVILSVNGSAIHNSEDFSAACAAEESLELLCMHEGKQYTAVLTPAKDQDGVYKIGAWVRDSTSGIGTLSFYDPQSLRFAALGHGVSDVDTGALLSFGNGTVYPAQITGVQYAANGQAGELVGTFPTDPADAIGTITQNTEFGIGGTLQLTMNQGETVPIAEPDEIRLGDAEIRSTVSEEIARSYRVRVIRTEVQASPKVQGMMIEITDPELLSLTGGIVQGMSGSPVLQDGKLIGIVTHVFLNDSRRGYCIYARWMYDGLL